MSENTAPLPDFTRWPSFPFEGDMRVKKLAPPVEVEPPRSGEDGADCVACGTPDDAYIWVSERWRVRAMDRPTGLPMVLILECRSHLDLGDLPNLLAAELGVMTVRLERSIRSLDDVARVHVNRWGDGSAHLHMWFLARPYGRLQLRGTFLSLWDDILPVIPEQKWRENLALVAAWLADFGGKAIAEPAHIEWESSGTLNVPGSNADGAESSAATADGTGNSAGAASATASAAGASATAPAGEASSTASAGGASATASASGANAGGHSDRGVGAEYSEHGASPEHTGRSGGAEYLSGATAAERAESPSRDQDESPRPETLGDSRAGSPGSWARHVDDPSAGSPPANPLLADAASTIPRQQIPPHEPVGAAPEYTDNATHHPAQDRWTTGTPSDSAGQPGNPTDDGPDRETTATAATDSDPARSTQPGTPSAAHGQTQSGSTRTGFVGTGVLSTGAGGTAAGAGNIEP
ncbi:hypothetical protein [Actinoplanes sp. HUAS TT8]|uniref:hypothetical protein n=1 Tax=Actinoplanes sp. HUAS TT8 TaxID=3447453 RepID=UPI003F52304C